MIKVLYSSGSDFRFTVLNGGCLLAHHAGEQEGWMEQLDRQTPETNI